ncbi:calcium-binding protein [Nocardioides antri]|uniref:Calcium-binding protein n=1 Tax=Nocardioides antri TaxID=2607659 RepID=A0A5B1M351_9ACTN|nr:hypothetical protein [Nocardioides antri]KAA1427161.1 hypothetical protein F0U47_06520 [Nocardioides antri]
MSATFVCLSALAVMPGVPPAAATGPTCAGLPATIVGTPGNDKIEGTGADDVILGRAGHDTVVDGAGDDVVCGGPGIDVFHSGEGDDLLRGGDDDDNLVGGPGRDVLLGGEGRDWALSWYWGEDESYGADEYWMGAGDDVVRLDARRGDGFAVYGGPGDDDVVIDSVPGTPLTMVGGPGEDFGYLNVYQEGGTTVAVHQGSQFLQMGDGPPGRIAQWEFLWLGGTHAWSYRGTAGPDQLMVPSGRFTGFLYGGNDLVSIGGTGPHFIDGGAGVMDSADAPREVSTCRGIEYGNCAPLYR